MAHDPFLTLPVGSCRDLLHVRHRARQVAQLLRFAPIDVIGIAAGAYLVAQQAQTLKRRARVCFTLVEQKLQVSLAPAAQDSSLPDGLLVLSKPLPNVAERSAPEDIAWLLARVHQLAPSTFQDEIRRHNEETLLLLAALKKGAGASDLHPNPSAA